MLIVVLLARLFRFIGDKFELVEVLNDARIVTLCEHLFNYLGQFLHRILSNFLAEKMPEAFIKGETGWVGFCHSNQGVVQ